MPLQPLHLPVVRLRAVLQLRFRLRLRRPLRRGRGDRLTFDPTLPGPAARFRGAPHSPRETSPCALPC